MKSYRTSEVAKIIGVHTNTVISYEKSGYINSVERSKNGYRIYTEKHIEQIKLVRLVLKSEIVKTYMWFEDKAILKNIAKKDLKNALIFSEKYLQQIEKEKNKEYETVKEIKEIIKNHLLDRKIHTLKRSDAAKLIGVSIDIIINWERNGILDVPRNPKNNYRIYTEYEIVLLKVIKILRDEGYITQCVRNMVKKLKANNFEFLNRENELLSPIEEKEKDIKNLISYLNTLINK